MGEHLFDEATNYAVAEECIPLVMIAKAGKKTSSEKINQLKQTTIVSASLAVAIEKDFIALVREFNELEDVADHMLQSIQVLESQLHQEKTTSAQLA